MTERYRPEVVGFSFYLYMNQDVYDEERILVSLVLWIQTWVKDLMFRIL
jgi:hypothetical protein